MVDTHMSSSFLTTHVFNSAASSSLTSIAAVGAGAPSEEIAHETARSSKRSVVKFLRRLLENGSVKRFRLLHRLLMRVHDVKRFRAPYKKAKVMLTCKNGLG